MENMVESLIRRACGIINYIHKKNINSSHKDCACDRCLGDIFRREYMEYIKNLPDEKSISFGEWVKRLKDGK